MLVFRDYDKLAFLNAYRLLKDTVESVKAGRRGKVELSKEETEAVLRNISPYLPILVSNVFNTP